MVYILDRMFDGWPDLCRKIKFQTIGSKNLNFLGLLSAFFYSLIYGVWNRWKFMSDKPLDFTSIWLELLYFGGLVSAVTPKVSPLTPNFRSGVRSII